ncbi:MAG: ATP-binding protein [Thermoanaerobaculaceae bacterium]|nr:ATP-binding protein [Thermoanaerobaculaceae bacterium]
MVRKAQMALQSRYENIELAEHMLLELGRECRIEEETLYWIGMALREALANAIKHGNKLSAAKRVFVEICAEPGSEVSIRVEDEGEGFDPSQLEDPTSPRNLLRSSGRGVFYMRSFMDEVRFLPGERGGTRIELVKRLHAGRD